MQDRELQQGQTPTSEASVRTSYASTQAQHLPRSLAWLYVSLLSFLKNGFSWVNRILTSSNDTVMILELINGYRVYIPCGNRGGAVRDRSIPAAVSSGHRSPRGLARRSPRQVSACSPGAPAARNQTPWGRGPTAESSTTSPTGGRRRHPARARATRVDPHAPPVPAGKHNRTLLRCCFDTRLLFRC